jgi:hypothetical protein
MSAAPSPATAAPSASPSETPKVQAPDSLDLSEPYFLKWLRFPFESFEQIVGYKASSQKVRSGQISFLSFHFPFFLTSMFVDEFLLNAGARGH